MCVRGGVGYVPRVYIIPSEARSMTTLYILVHANKIAECPSNSACYRVPEYFD